MCIRPEYAPVVWLPYNPNILRCLESLIIDRMDERLLSSSPWRIFLFRPDHHSRSMLSLVCALLPICPPFYNRTRAYPLFLSSFTCFITSNTQDIAFCTSVPPNSSISVLAVIGSSTTGTSSLTSVSAALSGSWIYSNFGGQVVQVKPVFVAYQSTDTEILYLLTPTLRPTPPATTIPNPTRPTPPAPTISNPATLSQSAKIAIAVTIPVVVLALILAISLLCIHRRRKSQPSEPSEHYETVVSQPRSEKSAPSGYAGETRAELEGSRLPIQEVR